MGASMLPGSGLVTITDCTLTNDIAQGGNGGGDGHGGAGDGAALFDLDGSVTLNDVTVAGTNADGTTNNEGGAIYTLAAGQLIQTGEYPSATLTLNNSILSGTTGSATSDLVSRGDGLRPITITGTNDLVQAQDLDQFTTLAPGVVVKSSDPQLGRLQDNGGLTPTMAITSSSPAYGSGNPSVGGLPANDQRGSGFPRLTNGRLDLGAFQVQANAPPPPPVQATTTSIILPVQDSYYYDNGLVHLLETMTAQVRITATGQPVNQGTMTLNDDGLEAVVPVQGGYATYTFTVDNSMQHSISATYNGAGPFDGSYAADSVTAPPNVPAWVLAQLELQQCIADFFQAIIHDI
jgi:hypothetical protein